MTIHLKLCLFEKIEKPSQYTGTKPGQVVIIDNHIIAQDIDIIVFIPASQLDTGYRYAVRLYCSTQIIVFFRLALFLQ